MASKSQLLAGFHALQARLRAAPQSLRELYFEAGRRDRRMQQLIESCEARAPQCRLHPVDAGRLNGLAQGSRHQGVVGLADPVSMPTSLDDHLDAVSGPLLILALDGVTDPHNLGACLRTADAAGVHAVIAPRDRAVGLNATVLRVACGAADSVPYFMVTNLVRTLRELKERDVWVIGTDDEAEQALHHVDLTPSVAWVMGAEGEGMRRLTRETCDSLVRIPMAGVVESLNVSVATGVCLYEAVRQRDRAVSLT